MGNGVDSLHVKSMTRHLVGKDMDDLHVEIEN